MDSVPGGQLFRIAWPREGLCPGASSQALRPPSPSSFSFHRKAFQKAHLLAAASLPRGETLVVGSRQTMHHATAGQSREAPGRWNPMPEYLITHTHTHTYVHTRTHAHARTRTHTQKILIPIPIPIPIHIHRVMGCSRNHQVHHKQPLSAQIGFFRKP